MNVIDKARFWLLDYVYAVRCLIPGVLTHPDPDEYLTGDGVKPPVLVLPGVYETWQFLRPLVHRLHEAGHPMHVVTDLGRNAGTVEGSARLVAEYLREHDLRDVVVVAHSKGGLIGKYLMLLLDPGARIDRMIAVATPFSGSRYARYVPVPTIRAFRPTDPTTSLLSADLRVNARIISIFGVFDPHIPEGSRLEGARNVELAEAGHFRILATPALQAALDAALDGGP